MMCRDVREALYQKGERPVTGDVVGECWPRNSTRQPSARSARYAQVGISVRRFENSANPTRLARLHAPLGKWFLKAPVSMAEDIISIAHQTRLPEGADIARRLLGTPAEAGSKAQALVSLAKFGTAADLDLIDKFVDDATVLENFEQEPRGDGIREERTAPPTRGTRHARTSDSCDETKVLQRTLGDVAVLAAGLKIAGFDLQELFPVIAQDKIIGDPGNDDRLSSRPTRASGRGPEDLRRDFRDKKTTPPIAVIQPASSRPSRSPNTNAGTS